MWQILVSYWHLCDNKYLLSPIRVHTLCYMCPWTPIIDRYQASQARQMPLYTLTSPGCLLWWNIIATLEWNVDGIEHDDVIKWKHFPRHWPFVRGIHPSPVNSPHKGQWRGALRFSLIRARINGWVNNGEVGDLIRHRFGYSRTAFSVSFLLFAPILALLEHRQMRTAAQRDREWVLAEGCLIGRNQIVVFRLGF